MSVFTQFTSGADNYPYTTQYFVSSGSWTAPQSGWATIVAVGGGGSGGAASQLSGGTYALATGGGAGGFAMKKVYIPSGTVLTITIGAGGATVTTPAGFSAATAGNAGGTTSISSSVVNITCNGGSGGQAGLTATGINGGAGGSASGGDVNYTGGDGGDIVTQTVANVRATGGGAVGVFGTGFSAGDVTGTGSDPCVTGGAGVGGRSANVTTFQVSGGGGSLSASTVTVSSISGTSAVGGAGVVSLYSPGTSVATTGLSLPTNIPGFSLIGAGGTGNGNAGTILQPSDGGPGAGGGANYRNSFAGGFAGGIFGGGGGTACNSDGFVQSGNGRYGGGSGGAAGRNITSWNATGSEGGQGIVAIVFQGN